MSKTCRRVGHNKYRCSCKITLKSRLNKCELRLGVCIENGKPDQVGESNCAQYYIQSTWCYLALSCTVFVVVIPYYSGYDLENTKPSTIFRFTFISPLLFLGLSSGWNTHLVFWSLPGKGSTLARTHASIHAYETHKRITGEHFRCDWCVLLSLITFFYVFMFLYICSLTLTSAAS